MKLRWREEVKGAGRNKGENLREQQKEYVWALDCNILEYDEINDVSQM